MKKIEKMENNKKKQKNEIKNWNKKLKKKNKTNQSHRLKYSWYSYQ